MKIFNTLKELWEYCEFCPICQDSTREITLAVGPEHNYCLYKDYSKKDDDLIIRPQRKYSKKTISLNINLLNNSFEFKRLAAALLPKIEYIYFWMDASCPVCERSFCNTADIELNFNNNTVEQFAIEREAVIYAQGTDSYRITLCHLEDIIYIAKCEVLDDKITTSSKLCDFTRPLVNIDLSSPDKTIRKIKTLLVFS
jgi:hypothetical protein